MRGRVLERRVDIEPAGLADATDLAEIAYALGRHAELGHWPTVVEALETFLASTLERVFRDAHVGLWEEYAGGERPAAEGEQPVGVYLSLVLGDQEEVLFQLPGRALCSPDADSHSNRDLAAGLRALAAELDGVAARQEREERR